MQNWSTLLEQGCIDELGENNECDSAVAHDYMFSSGSTMPTDFLDVHIPLEKDEDMSSKKQLRCVFHPRTVFNNLINRQHCTQRKAPVI